MTAWAVLEVLGVGIAVLLLAWTLLLFAPFRWRPVGLYLWFEKVAAGAFTPFIAATGLLLALVGVLVGSWWLAHGPRSACRHWSLARIRRGGRQPTALFERIPSPLTVTRDLGNAGAAQR